MQRKPGIDSALKDEKFRSKISTVEKASLENDTAPEISLELEKRITEWKRNVYPKVQERLVIFPKGTELVPVEIIPLFLAEAMKGRDDIIAQVDFMEEIPAAIREGRLIVRAESFAIINVNYLQHENLDKPRRRFFVGIDDLKAFLNKNYKMIEVEVSTQDDVALEQTAPIGISKDEALRAFEDLINIPLKKISLKRALEDPPGWLLDARLQKGTRGKRHPTIWSPVILAIALQDRFQIPPKKINKVFAEHSFLSRWVDEWKEKSDQTNT